MVKYGILIQGKISAITKKIVEEYSNNFKDSMIILSTWKGENIEDFPCKIIKSKIPEKTFPYQSSINHQKIGALSGLKEMDCDIIMKCRTDMFIHNKDIFKLFKKSCPKNKIMIPNYITLDDVDYFASDLCQIGTKELLLEYWNSIPEYNGDIEISHPEIYFTLNYILKGKKDLLPWKKCLKKYFYVRDFLNDFQIEWEILEKSKQYKDVFNTMYSKCVNAFPDMSFFSSQKENYVNMQKSYYAESAKKSNYENDQKTDYVVGSYEKQNTWKDHSDFIFKNIDDGFKNKIALEFGCGPCRNIIKYSEKFLRIDGCDISPENIENGKKNLKFHEIKIPNLYVTNGDDLGAVEHNIYDFIFSTITLQHICVYEIRFSIFNKMYQALKKNGRISIQMGFGVDSPSSKGYYENFYAAEGTNRACDTRVEEPKQIKKDLEKIGFKKFEYWIRPTGPGDSHPNWIYFTAVK